MCPHRNTLWEYKMSWSSGARTVHTPRRHLEVPGARTVTWRNSHKEDPRKYGATLRRSVEQVTWSPKLCTPVVNLVPTVHSSSSSNRKLQEFWRSPGFCFSFYKNITLVRIQILQIRSKQNHGKQLYIKYSYSYMFRPYRFIIKLTFRTYYQKYIYCIVGIRSRVSPKVTL